MIAGFEEPTSGRILLRGGDVTRVPPAKRHVNMVFQSYALFPHMSVFENVAFGLRVKRVSRDEIRTRVAEMLRSVRLEGHGGAPAGHSSRAASSSASRSRARSSTSPAALLLDEPLGALDLKLRQEMQLELKEIQTRTRTTFVYVTHDQEEALTMSDRIAVMNERPGRADRRAARALRTSGDAVRRRFHRHLESARHCASTASTPASSP